jgi:hypothetical protein
MIRWKHHLAGLAITVFAPATGASTMSGRMPCAYTTLVVPYTPGVFVVALDINENSEVCGFRQFIDHRLPFYWSAETGIVVLPLPPGFVQGEAHGISEEGDIVGVAIRADEGRFPAIWRDGIAQALPTPLPGYTGEAVAIADETAVGWWSSFGFHALRWDAGSVSTIRVPIGPNSGAWDIAPGGPITGWMGGAWTQDSVAFLTVGRQAIDLGTIPGGQNGRGVAVSPAGHVAMLGVIEIDGVLRLRSALWFQRQYIDPGTLPDCHTTRIEDVNAHGAMVGVSQADVFGPGGPFIWYDGIMRRLQDLSVDRFHGVSIPYAINDKWEITGRSLSGGELVVMLPVIGSPADITGDCRADHDDLAALLTAWGETDSPADLDRNGIVNISDLLLLLALWS